MIEVGPSVLWTIMPAELVVQGLPGEAQPACRELHIEGRIIEVLPGPDGTAIIQRLLSTDPSDFLDPKWQPGTRVCLHKELKA